MKKLIFSFLLLIILLLAAFYIFVPNKITLQKSVVIKTPERVLINYLSPHSDWQKWWPGMQTRETHKSGILNLQYKEASFSFKQQNYYKINSVDQIGNFTSNGNITFFIVNDDSTRVIWTSAAQTGVNPIEFPTLLIDIKKIVRYKAEILSHLKAYLENEKNIYGINIQKSTITDTLVLTTRITTTQPPSNDVIYQLINDLREYIRASNAKETNYPIYNITRIEPSGYQTMVAIAIDKSLPQKGNILTKRMVKANVLETEVKGGNITVENAINQLNLYIKDNSLSSPAIPFARLVTNRVAQPDSSRWITRVYYPVY